MIPPLDGSLTLTLRMKFGKRQEWKLPVTLCTRQ